MSALAVVPPQTLFALEEHLASMLDTEALVPADQAPAFQQELSAALQTTIQKRDRVHQFLCHLETQAEQAAVEIKRLTERKAFFEKVAERMESYVIRTIESLGLDEKGKPRKLEGSTVTLSIANCPASVHIADPEKVPAEYRHVTVKLPQPLWEAILDSLDMEVAASVLDRMGKPDVAISKTELKGALAAGPVPGAQLITDKKRLVRK